MDQRSPPPPPPPPPPPAPPVPYNALFSGMQYDPPPPTPTESSSMLSGMQYEPSPPTLTGSLSMQHNRQVPTPTLHVPQTMRYEQSVGPVAGRYRAKFQTSPAGLTRQNYEFITDMIDSEGPLPTNSSLALANTVSCSSPSPIFFFASCCIRYAPHPLLQTLIIPLLAWGHYESHTKLFTFADLESGDILFSRDCSCSHNRFWRILANGAQRQLRIRPMAQGGQVDA